MMLSLRVASIVKCPDYPNTLYTATDPYSVPIPILSAPTFKLPRSTGVGTIQSSRHPWRYYTWSLILTLFS